MTWWTYILLGVTWIAVVVITLIISFNAAANAVSASLAADPNELQIGTAVVSAIVFAGPGVFLIMIGLRQQRRHSQN